MSDSESSNHDLDSELDEIASTVQQPLQHKPLGDFKSTAAKVKEFPQSPGVYLFKDASGVVIYVG
ncbi:MAG: excinuclease ABC subunit UvrC, partial [Planctomycetota bacterium]